MLLTTFSFLSVFPVKSDITINGISSEVQVGIRQDVTCTVPNIKPESDMMYWKFNNGEIKYGSTVSTRNKNEKTFKEVNTVSHS